MIKQKLQVGECVRNAIRKRSNIGPDGKVQVGQGFKTEDMGDGTTESYMYLSMSMENWNVLASILEEWITQEEWINS